MPLKFYFGSDSISDGGMRHGGERGCQAGGAGQQVEQGGTIQESGESFYQLGCLVKLCCLLKPEF